MEDNYFVNDDIDGKKDIQRLSKIYDELKLKNYFSKNLIQIQESIGPYPRLYFLSDQKLEKIKSLNKLSLSEISKYYSKINYLQELEISSHNNKNNITGIKIFSERKKDDF